MDARIEPLAGALPTLLWRWDAETDILSGAFKGNRAGSGLTGTIELTDEVGSIAVVDVHNGVICGLDIVVWPAVDTLLFGSIGGRDRVGAGGPGQAD